MRTSFCRVGRHTPAVCWHISLRTWRRPRPDGGNGTRREGRRSNRRRTRPAPTAALARSPLATTLLGHPSPPSPPTVPCVTRLRRLCIPGRSVSRLSSVRWKKKTTRYRHSARVISDDAVLSAVARQLFCEKHLVHHCCPLGRAGGGWTYSRRYPCRSTRVAIFASAQSMTTVTDNP